MLPTKQPLVLWLSWLTALLMIVGLCLGGAYSGAWRFADVREIVMAVVGGLMVSFSPSPMSSIRSRAADMPPGQNQGGPNGR